MLKNQENKGTEEIGLVIPTPDSKSVRFKKSVGSDRRFYSYVRVTQRQIAIGSYYPENNNKKIYTVYCQHNFVRNH